MKTIKEYVKNYLKDNYERIGRDSSNELKAYKQGFIDATNLAAENAKVVEFYFSYEENGKRVNIQSTKRIYQTNDHIETDKQSILKAIEE